MRSLFGEGGKSNTDQAAIRLAPALSFADRRKVDQARGAAEALGVITAVKVLVCHRNVGHGGGPNQIVEANFVGFAADGTRDRIDRQFDRETDARSCDT